MYGSGRVERRSPGRLAKSVPANHRGGEYGGHSCRLEDIAEPAGLLAQLEQTQNGEVSDHKFQRDNLGAEFRVIL